MIFKRRLINKLLFFVALFLMMTVPFSLFASDMPVQDEAADSEISAEVVSPDELSADSESEPASQDRVEETVAEALERMPKLFSFSAELLNGGNVDRSEELIKRLSALIDEDRSREAARILGAAFSAERRGSYRFIGLYSGQVLANSENIEEAAAFLTDFISGYGTSGVMLMNTGFDSFYTSGLRRGEMWRSVPEGKAEPGKFERVYVYPKAVVVPFSKGEIFKIDVLGKPNATLKVWKILPNGVNSKSFEGGSWEREITIRGDKIY